MERLENLKLKRMVTVELVSAVAIVVVVLLVVQTTPYLASSKPSSQIGVFNQKEYVQNTVSILAGQKTSCRFNYSSFDPAILVIDLDFQNWQTSGNLALYCNGIHIVTIEATQRNPEVQLTTITVSGFDLVKPHYQLSALFSTYTYGNEISFSSPLTSGYEGTFSYKISIRGSR